MRVFGVNVLPFYCGLTPMTLKYCPFGSFLRAGFEAIGDLFKLSPSGVFGNGSFIVSFSEL